jgi:hypothetical protein
MMTRVSDNLGIEISSSRPTPTALAGTAGVTFLIFQARIATCRLAASSARGVSCRKLLTLVVS